MATGFFSNRALPKQVQGKQGAVYDLIDAGGELFHATAVALIDYMSLTPRVNDVTLKKILERFYQYFPRYISNQSYLRLADRMQMLCTNSHKSKVVECMAYVLLQLTIDELLADPLEYREIFDGLSTETPKGYLRDPKTVLPAIALAALAKTLDLTIALTYKELDKELGKRVLYMGASKSLNPALVIQVQHDAAAAESYVYFPGVKCKKDFDSVGQLAITGPQPVENAREHEGTLAETIALIKENNATLLHDYEHHRTALLSMVNAGELSSVQVRDHYIALLPAEDASFIMKLAQAKQPMIAGVPVASEKAIVESRVGALASWAAAGLIESDALYSRIDAAPGA
ncbi:MAG: hypothetical protein P4L65_06060 [Legionella sp.]|nr:hypothetical protein [Legionella sp.]